MSIRLRLTLWYVSLLAVILIVFSGALYSVLAFSLYNEVDRTLETRAGEVQRGVDAALQVQNDIHLLFMRDRFVLPGADVFASQGTYVQITAPDGTVVSSSANLGTQSLSVNASMLDRVNQGDSIFTNSVASGVRLRMYVAPLRARDQIVGAIVVAEPTQPVADTLRRLATLLAFGIIGGLVVAAFVGALLARSALAPIDRVTQSARGIAHSGDLSRRVEQRKTHDEVGRLATTFNEMLARIEELFRSQQRFVADMSHELRSPLTTIRGNLDLLRRGAFENNQERDASLAAIDSESARMQRMVQDLLLLAQADAGVELRKQPIELDTLLLDVYRQARMMANGVKVSLGCEDQAQVLGDPDRLKQLFINLIDNAIKYTPNGGEVKLSFERDTEWVRVAVADTGAGIPEQDLPKIFDRFYRVDKARSRENGGAGLGLAIVKWVVDAHGGKIDVESQRGKGTIFTVWLPLASKN
jgi:two-component system, OmpR family, sensor kinase